MKRSKKQQQVIDVLVAMAALLAGSTLAFHYPLGVHIAIPGFLLFVLLQYYQPHVSLITIPALLPILGFAPWTGWITFEELDLLVLATAAGGYARHASENVDHPEQRTSLLFIALAALMSLSILISMTRGFLDAGGFAFGWFQGYDGPMNSLRIAKSFFLALLLVPLQLRLRNDSAAKTDQKLAIGLALALGTASLAALVERLAFTGLLNFSSDYRTTALFWEMHVGGAALDGWLLLTIPFSIFALRKSTTMGQFLAALLLALLAAYACLTTFSRGVYLALMVSLPLLAWNTRSKSEGKQLHKVPALSLSRWSVALILFGTIAGFVFPHSGYRGLLALIGAVAIAAYLPPLIKNTGVKQSVLGIIAGLLSGGILLLLARYIPKGAYLLYSLVFLSNLALLFLTERRKLAGGSFYCIIGFIALVLSATGIAEYWGGTDALPGMSIALLLLSATLIAGTIAPTPLWPHDIRWYGTMIAVAAAVFTVTAVFSGGKYMEERFSTSGKDVNGRIAHWSQALDLLRSPSDIAFGKGLGRFPANYFFAIPNAEFPGTYRISTEGDNAWLSLVAPHHPVSFGNILRVSQRLSINETGPFEARFRVRASSDASIHIEVCEKQLLYNENCAIGHLRVKATHGEWQPQSLKLQGPLLTENTWYAPRFKMFSIGIGEKGEMADIDGIVLFSSNRVENILKNGDFTNEMQHWFFSSDRDHMPWHAKNLLVNITFDQGIAGLTLFLSMTFVALWRLNFGKARALEISPYLSASIIGFLIVGLFDSLTDVPRLAFAYYIVVLYALSLRNSPGQKDEKQVDHKIQTNSRRNRVYGT